MPRWLKIALGPTGGQVAIIVLAVPIIYLFGFREMRFFLVPSGSMEPTLLRGDYVVTLSDKEYRRGDVVVLEDPEEAGSFIVKRIVAVGGDTVRINGGALIVNGQYVSEPYIFEPPSYVLEEIQIPDHEFFVLGDNRNDSEDSHIWHEKGLNVHLTAHCVVGRVWFIYYPYDRAGEVNSCFLPVSGQKVETR